MEEKDQALARADAQAWWNKVRVAGKSSCAIAHNAGDGEGDDVVGKLSLAEEHEVFSGKGYVVLSLTNGIVAEFAFDGAVARVGAACKVAVKSLVDARRDGQVEQDVAVRRGEEILELDRFRG